MDKNKKVILFMPSMDGGGVEKNLIIVANYLVNKNLNVILITYDTKFNSRFNNKIKILNVTKNKKEKHSKYFKYYKCLLILIKTCLSNSNFLVLSFQANIYCAILSKFFQTYPLGIFCAYIGILNLFAISMPYWVSLIPFSNS